MAADQEPEVSGRKNLLTICLLIIILLMFAYAVFGSRGVLRILQAEQQKQELERQLADLERQQQQLREEIERLQKDKTYWEHLARTRLGMVREGELIYHLPDPEKQDKKEPEER